MKQFLLRLAGPFFVGAGALHFIWPETYDQVVPDYLPARRALVYASGVAEIAGGLGMLNRSTRRIAGWWLIGLLVAVFPANIWMAQHPDRYHLPGGRAALYARLPLQLVLIAWVRRASRP